MTILTDLAERCAKELMSDLEALKGPWTHVSEAFLPLVATRYRQERFEEILRASIGKTLGADAPGVVIQKPTEVKRFDTSLGWGADKNGEAIWARHYDALLAAVLEYAQGSGDLESFQALRMALGLSATDAGQPSDELALARDKIAELERTLRRTQSAALAGMNAAKAISSEQLVLAQKLHAESSPESLNSERAANAILTERVEELEAELLAMRQQLASSNRC